ncbi:prenyltransferase [Legionella beliardensis]|uniref:Prenyltransferase n=1 Tax=Legionella beliardensis TaxID=91822 RepID=A0A378I4V6_9GAMM|nr:UbiA-like protein EboC [Legionella beliardensis]STX29726.1 prenyltransferase [Legionella beliardensis]
MKKITGLLRLLRPANIVTSCADILAGFGIVGMPILMLYPEHTYLLILLLLLLLSTACLYGGGVVLNDALDAELDQIERPERPIPQHIISQKQAILFAIVLMLIGMIAAFLVNVTSGLLASAIALLSVFYDAYTKHSLWLGPINMGLCRGGNLLLGISIIQSALLIYWPLMAIPFFFISGVTLISKGEVHGSSKAPLFIALFLYALAIIGTMMLNFTPNFYFLPALPFFLLFICLSLYSLIKVIFNPAPLLIRKAVKTGILCLIILDAGIASGYAGSWYGILLLLIMLTISTILAKKFPMT